MAQPVTIDRIDSAALEDSPIWRYFSVDEVTFAEPTGETVATDLTSKILGLRVRLSNGETRWALLMNLSLKNALSNQHFLALSLEDRGEWFPLARYHDADWERNGPQGLAIFLGLPVDSIFPLTYDAAPFVRGATVPMSGTIEADPASRLSEAQLMSLAVSSSI